MEQVSGSWLLSIYEKVKPVFARGPLWIRAIPLHVCMVEMSQGAGRGTKQGWLFVSGQAAKPVTVHNFRPAMRTRLSRFAIVSRKG